MILVAISLITIGVIASLMGAKLFKLLLPILGLVTGFLVGFLGFQQLFGTTALNPAGLSLVVALVIGLVLAVLSYVFFDLAVIFYAIAAGATAGTYLGVVLGLNKEGFIVLLLAIAGAILAGSYALTHNLGLPLVIAITSILGVAYILVGLFLITGSVKVEDVTENGVVDTLIKVVDQTFIWLLVWIGGSLLGIRLQSYLHIKGYGSDSFEFVEAKK